MAGFERTISAPEVGQRTVRRGEEEHELVRRHSGFQHVIFEILTSDQMQAQLQTGTIQYMYPVIPTQIASVKAIKGVSVGEAQGVSADTLGMNYAAPVLKDPRVGRR